MARQKKKETFDDLGFGDKLTNNTGGRLIRQNGQLNVERTGLKTLAPYQSLVEMSWMRFLLLVLVTYILINLFFAMLFCLAGTENLNGLEPDGPLPAFWEAFFFSVQSFTTVGYGAVSPSGFWANMVAALDALTGLMSVALATGLIFARFSKPRAQILFSDFGIIAPYGDIKSFQFRIVNKRSNKIIDLEARVTATWLEPLGNGRNKRHFEILKLERNKVFLFPLNWTIVHPIDSNSPLFGKSKEELDKIKVEFLIMLRGYDESFNQLIHANKSYICDEIKWGARFKPMYYEDENGTTLEIDKINEIERIDF